MSAMHEQTKAMQTHVRPATTADLERLVILAEQLGYPTDKPELERRLAQLEHLENRAVLVAVADDLVVGFIDLDHRTLMISNMVAEICGLVVDEHARGSGHGKALLSAAEEWARSKGCSKITLKSNIIRKDAHRFYEREGYEVFKTQYAFRKTLV